MIPRTDDQIRYDFLCRLRCMDPAHAVRLLKIEQEDELRALAAAARTMAPHVYQLIRYVLCPPGPMGSMTRAEFTCVSRIAAEPDMALRVEWLRLHVEAELAGVLGGKEGGE